MKYNNYILKILPILSYSYNKKEFSVNISYKKIYEILTFFKYHTNCQYKLLSDLCVVDYPFRKNRFDLIYNLLSIKYNSRLRIKVIINELQTIPSIINIYRCSNWWEREVWDMYGVFFSNHPDLRRILTDYGFEGYPLRKDFPLSGFFEVYYSELKKQVIYEKISLSQEFRSFNFENPWI